MPPLNLTREQAIEILRERARNGNNNAGRLLKNKGISLEPTFTERTQPKGAVGKFVRDIFKPAVTLAARPVQLGLAASGKAPKDQRLNLPFFGEIDTVSGKKDVIRDTGRVLETVALGVGGGGLRAVGNQALKRGATKTAAKTAQKVAARPGVRKPIDERVLDSLSSGSEARAGLNRIINAKPGKTPFRSGVRVGGKTGLLEGAGGEIKDTGDVDIGTFIDATAGGILGAATGGALGKLGDVAVKSIAKRSGQSSGILGKLRQGTLEEEALEITKPILKRGGNVARIKQGSQGSVQKGILRKRPEILPDARDKEIAKAASSVISKRNSPQQNIDAIQSTVTPIDNIIDRALGSIDGPVKGKSVIFNTKQLENALSKIKKDNDLLFATDKTVDTAFSKVFNDFTKAAKKNNLAELFKARKELDRQIDATFPNFFDRSTGTINQTNAQAKNIYGKMRSEVNQFIADNIPDDVARQFDELIAADPFLREVIPAEVRNFKGLLKHENLLLTALERIAQREAEKVGRLSLPKKIGIGALGAVGSVGAGIVGGKIVEAAGQ